MTIWYLEPGIETVPIVLYDQIFKQCGIPSRDDPMKPLGDEVFLARIVDLSSLCLLEPAH